MPCILRVKIIKARRLPIMDQRTRRADSYVELISPVLNIRTEVQWNTLEPEWGHEEQMEVADNNTLLQEPLEFRLWDHDKVADDIIGSVYINLGPAMSRKQDDTKIRIGGWFPIYDTLRGISGELQVSISIEIIGDVSKSLESSVGVSVHGVSKLPKNYRLVRVYGFVEEIDMIEDPEHRWNERFYAASKTNAWRQKNIMDLSSRIRKPLCKKVADWGGNAILGYQLNLDFEFEKEIVAMAYGTACRIEKISDDDDDQPSNVIGSTPALPISSAYALNRQPSLPATPVSASLETEAPISEGLGAKYRSRREGSVRDDFAAKQLYMANKSLQEVQLLTLTSLPQGCILRIGGLVGAKAVKLIRNKRSEFAEALDEWWREVRSEVQSHAKELSCYHVMGYSESLTVDRDVYILSAEGTAVVLDTNHPQVKIHGKQEGNKKDAYDEGSSKSVKGSRRNPQKRPSCSMLHTPYSRGSSPFQGNMTNCQICGKKSVPYILLSSFDIPSNLTYTGSGKFIEARISRTKKRTQGETNAVAISDMLLFVENDLYSQFVTKLRLLGRNAVFGVRTQLVIGESLIAATFSGTAVNLDALPSPSGSRIFQSMDALSDKQRAVAKDIENYALVNSQGIVSSTQPIDALFSSPASERRHRDSTTPKMTDLDADLQSDGDSSDSSSSSNGSGSQDDESENIFCINIEERLIESDPLLFKDPVQPDFLNITTTDSLSVPNMTPTHVIEHFSSVFRFELPSSTKLNQSVVLSMAYQRIQESLFFKIQDHRPVGVSGLKTTLQILDDSKIQIFVDGTLVKLEPVSGASVAEVKVDLSSPGPSENQTPIQGPQRLTIPTVNQNPFIFTSQSFIPGMKIEDSKGRVDLYFIKEANSLSTVVGGLGAFLHGMLIDAQTIARAYLLSIQCNAFVGYRVDLCHTKDDISPDNAYFVILIGGDAVVAKPEDTLPETSSKKSIIPAQ